MTALGRWLSSMKLTNLKIQASSTTSIASRSLRLSVSQTQELFNRIDGRLVSRLRSSEHARLDKYHDEQLYE
jgi:hypothetical protein